MKLMCQRPSIDSYINDGEYTDSDGDDSISDSPTPSSERSSTPASELSTKPSSDHSVRSLIPASELSMKPSNDRSGIQKNFKDIKRKQVKDRPGTVVS